MEIKKLKNNIRVVVGAGFTPAQNTTTNTTNIVQRFQEIKKIMTKKQLGIRNGQLGIARSNVGTFVVGAGFTPAQNTTTNTTDITQRFQEIKKIKKNDE